MKRRISAILCMILLLSTFATTGYAIEEEFGFVALSSEITISPPIPPVTPVVFSDVSSTHWANLFVSGFARRGITFLADGKEFRPNALMDRKTVVYTLFQIAGETCVSSSDSGFSDVSPSDVTAPYIKWARDNGIVKGASATTFLPDQPITRQDLATILGQYAETFGGIDLLPINPPRQFKDAGSIAGYAADYIARLQVASVITGFSDGTFRPRQPITRAEAAAMLWQFFVGPQAYTSPEQAKTIPAVNAYQPLSPQEINTYILSFLPTVAGEARAYIKETPTNDYKSKTIRDAAAAISAGASTEYKKLQATYDYVISKMSYATVTSRSGFSSASEALKSGYGICSDYTTVTIALLNAQGIPAAYVASQVDYLYPSGKISLSNSFERDKNHAFVAAFVNGAWCYCDPTWGEADHARYFDMSISTLSRTHVVWAIMPPGRPTGHSSSVTIINLAANSPKVVVDGRTVQEDFRFLRSDSRYYFSLRDFAAILSKYAKAPGKCFTPLMSSFEHQVITIYPGSKYQPTGGEFDNRLLPDKGAPFARYVGIGGLTKETEVIVSAEIAYVHLSVMLDICAALDISIRITEGNVTIDTTKPYNS